MKPSLTLTFREQYMLLSGIDQATYRREVIAARILLPLLVIILIVAIVYLGTAKLAGMLLVAALFFGVPSVGMVILAIWGCAALAIWG